MAVDRFGDFTRKRGRQKEIEGERAREGRSERGSRPFFRQTFGFFLVFYDPVVDGLFLHINIFISLKHRETLSASSPVHILLLNNTRIRIIMHRAGGTETNRFIISSKPRPPTTDYNYWKY